jgi:hypothetical protein
MKTRLILLILVLLAGSFLIQTCKPSPQRTPYRPADGRVQRGTMGKGYHILYRKC